MTAMPVKRRTSEARKRGGDETGPVAEAFARHSIAEPSREARKGKRRVEVSAVAVDEGDRPLFRHVMLPHRDAPSPRAVSIALTPRQQQVLLLLADGVPARVIAERLGLAEATVRNHIRAILAAFEAHSQLEAIAKARRLQLIT